MRRDSAGHEGPEGPRSHQESGQDDRSGTPSSIHGVADDDIVTTREEAADNEREPLLVVQPLLEFFDTHDLGSGEPAFKPIGDGHSNVTYLVERGGAQFVLRRPPRGPLPPSAHDVIREATLLRALEGTETRTPAVLAPCDDESLIGAPFYLMEYVPGHAVIDAVPAALDSEEDRRRMGEELIDALVEIHAVDWRAAGLESFGKPSGYCERQLRRFLGLWDMAKQREIPQVESVAKWLGDNLPSSPSATIVHGDYRLGNTLISPEAPARVVTVLDWEMATIGDPLADVGYLATLWSDRDDPPNEFFDLSKATREPGFSRREELLDRYQEMSGRSITDIRWYQTLALWKSIVFMENNYQRAARGASDDPYLKSFEQGVPDLARRAEKMALGA